MDPARRVQTMQLLSKLFVSFYPNCGLSVLGSHSIYIETDPDRCSGSEFYLKVRKLVVANYRAKEQTICPWKSIQLIRSGWPVPIKILLSRLVVAIFRANHIHYRGQCKNLKTDLDRLVWNKFVSDSW